MYDGNESDVVDGGASEGENEDRPVMMNPAELKKLFKLDPAVEAKLAKIK